jgi:hypothetical protein
MFLDLHAVEVAMKTPDHALLELHAVEVAMFCSL